MGTSVAEGLQYGFNHVKFGDARACPLREHAIRPIQNPVEMVEGRLSSLEVNVPGISESIAVHARTVISSNSAVDKLMMDDQKAMDEAAARHPGLPKGKARCILCHNGSNFTVNQFRNLGVPRLAP